MNTPINVEALAIKAYQSTKVTEEQNSVPWEDADEPLKIYYRTIAGAIAQALQDDFNQQLMGLAVFLNQHQNKYWRVKDDEVKPHTPYQIKLATERAIFNYKEEKTTAVANLKTFQEDVLVYLRSISLYAESIGKAATHAEKDARLRGLVEVLETAIRNVRHREKDLISRNWSKEPDIFRSEYHVVYFLGEIETLKHDNKKLMDKLQIANQILVENNLKEVKQEDWTDPDNF